MSHIRNAAAGDISRIAEILVFTKRMQYRPIFQNDAVSFGEIQVLPTAQEYIDDPQRLAPIWVYDDGIIKGLIHIENGEICELYVDPFFHGEGVGSQLIEFAIHNHNADRLWVLEKNAHAIRFYEKHGFSRSGERKLVPDTPEYVMLMTR